MHEHGSYLGKEIVRPMDVKKGKSETQRSILTRARASKRTACEALFLLTFFTTSVPIKMRCKT
jgi:hypothetical protein